jgi:hypothetical protein
MRPFTFTLSGIPRTKKNSSRIVRIKAKGGGRGFTKLLPSEAYEQWLEAVLLQGAQIRYQLQRAGYKLPITEEVGVKALVFRDRLSGDFTGFTQAIGDALHAPMFRFKCAACGNAQHEYSSLPTFCKNCGRTILLGKETRKGLGIILDDSQIAHFDGSRLFKDSARPRVEVTIAAFTESPVQVSLLADMGVEKW